jgi:hypothetical protein
MCLFKPSVTLASFSAFDDSLMVFDQADPSDKEKQVSFLVTAEIVASLNESTLCKTQK